MTFKDLLLISTLVLYENLHYTNAVPTLDIKWRRPVIEKNLTFSCRSDGEITQSVLFLTKRESVSSPQGGCLASGTCDTAVPGYAVTQDRTARITTLFITSFDMNRDDQTWICKDGSSDSLEYNVPPTTLADIDCIPSQPGPIAKEGILTVTCETSCVYPEAKYSVEVLSGGSGPVPSVTSNDSCTGENVTTKNVFEMMGNSSQVACEVMFKVSIEHDSFIDFYPTYTLIKEIGPFMFPDPINILIIMIVIIILDVLTILVVIILVFVKTVRRIFRWILLICSLALIVVGLVFIILIATQACKPLSIQAVIAIVFSVIAFPLGGVGIYLSVKWKNTDDDRLGCKCTGQSPTGHSETAVLHPRNAESQPKNLTTGNQASSQPQKKPQSRDLPVPNNTPSSVRLPPISPSQHGNSTVGDNENLDQTGSTSASSIQPHLNETDEQNQTDSPRKEKKKSKKKKKNRETSGETEQKLAHDRMTPVESDG